jgi:tetratricopeptide (TPR) repeat protein
MEFVVLLDSQSPYGLPFRIACDQFTLSLRVVIDIFRNFVEINGFPEFQPSLYHLYVYDQSDPFSPITPSEITSLDTKLIDLRHDSFDLLLSVQSPAPPVSFLSSIPPIPPATESDKLLQESLEFIDSGDFRSAFDRLQKMIVLRPTDERPFVHMIRIFIRVRLFEQALKNSNSAVQRFPTNAKLRILCGIAHYKSHLYSQSLEILLLAGTFVTANQNDKDESVYYAAKVHFNVHCFSDSKRLLLTILSSVTFRGPAALMLARIAILEGDLTAAVRTFLDSEDSSPNYKYFKKFIGRFLSIPQSIQIVLDEAADSYKNAAAVFFLGRAMSDAGHCEHSKPMTLHAFLLSPGSPSITLGLLELELARSVRLRAILDIVDEFLKASHSAATYLLKTQADSIGDLIGQDFKSDWVSDASVFEAQPYRLLKFHDRQPSFTTNELEILAIFTRLQIRLFTDGYLQASYRISSAIFPLIESFLFTRTIIRTEAILSLLIHSTITTISRPLPPHRNFIFAIGGTAVVPLAYRTIQLCGTPTVIRPIIIPGFTFAIFRSRSQFTFAFERALAEIPPSSSIIICFGEEDGEFVSQRIRMLPDPTMPLSILGRSISALIGELDTFPHFHFFLHPIPPLGKSVCSGSVDLNRMLRNAAVDRQEHRPAVHFLDIMPRLMDDRKDTIRPEYSVDGVHLSPGYVPVLEAYLNELPKDSEANRLAEFFTLDVE